MREDVEAEPVAEGVAGPGPEDRGEQDERQPAAGRAADQDVQRRTEDADEHREDDRRPDHRGSITSADGSGAGVDGHAGDRRPGDAAAAEARLAVVEDSRPGPARPPRPAPRSRRSSDRRVRSRSMAGRTVAGTSVARWRIRTAARKPSSRRTGRLAGDERDVLELDRARLEVRPPAEDECSSSGRSRRRSAARRARRPGPALADRVAGRAAVLADPASPSASTSGPGSGVQPARSRSASR